MRRTLAVNGLTVAAAAALIILAALSIRATAAQIRRERGAREWMLKTFTAIADLYNDRAKAHDVATTLGNLIPTTIEVPTRMIPQTQTMARAHNVRVELKLSDTRPESATGPAGVTFSLRADGALQSIIDFLMDLESNKLVQVGGWELLPAGSTAYQLTLSGVVYTQPEP
jgi:hypothetical protein